MTTESALLASALTLVLVLVNAFFVAAEYSFIRVRTTQLVELAAAGSVRARMGARIAEKLDSYISAAQLGVTFASLGLGALGEPAVAALIAPAFGWLLDRSETLYHVVSFGLAFAAITYVEIVVGELAPKYLSIQRALPVALWCAYPLHAFSLLMYPFIRFVNGSASALVRRFGIKPRAELEPHSEEELKMLVAISARKGVLQESERVLLGRALDFADTLVRQVMVPRTEIVAAPDDTPLQGLLAMAREHPFTRIPVYREDIDHIVGFVHFRDLVGVDRSSRATARDLLRRIPTFPETMRLDQAIAEFRRQRTPLAVVIDEFGGTAGLVTLDDVLEELVGPVRDEFDKEAATFREEAPGIYLVDGLTSLTDLRERLHLELADEPYDTVGGMAFGRLGRLAAIGDAVEVEGHRFAVTAIDGRRVAQVRIQRAPARRRPGTSG